LRQELFYLAGKFLVKDMQVLILSYSEIAKRRVIPAIQAISDISGIDLASHRAKTSITLPKDLGGNVYDDYQQALSKSKASLVYISSVNSLHKELAQAALSKGFHVIVDKPAFASLKEAEELVNLARKSNLCLAEATVYAYHPQIKMAKDIFSANKTEPQRLIVSFSFPPLAHDNFRYSRSLGGGAFYDLGPYAVSPGRLFFGEEPKEMYCTINNRDSKDNLEVSFSLLAIYSKGRSMVGHFGFDTEYRNSISFLGKDTFVDIERIFTIPVEMENEFKIVEKNQKRTLRIAKADCFELFLREVLISIKKKNYRQFYDDLISDAAVLGRLRKAATNY